LVISGILLGTSIFGFYSHLGKTDMYLRPEALSGRWINTTSISTITAAAGTLMTAIMSYAYVSLCRRWMYATRDQEHKSKEWQAIGDSFYLFSVWNAHHFYWGWCSLAMVLGALVSPALSGTLVPSLADTTVNVSWSYPLLSNHATVLGVNCYHGAAQNSMLVRCINIAAPHSVFAGLYNIQPK
jgi:hypothetical protein